VYLNTQNFASRDRTSKYRPAPSPYRPGFVPFSTNAAVSPFARRGT
jgi:hypothetical protein